MLCPRCHQEIPQSSKFCPECGASLSTGGNQIEDQASILRNYIPKELAARMMSAGKVLEGERRIVQRKVQRRVIKRRNL